MKRRNFIEKISIASAGALLAPKTWAIPPSNKKAGKLIRFGIISDLHNMQFSKLQVSRLKEFMDAVLKTPPDFIIQNGDFCQVEKSEEVMAEWNRFRGVKYHVLGNHDMDTCDKETIMNIWGMKRKYYSFDKGGYHFIVMDRNFIRNDDGTFIDYSKGNWGPLAAPKRSFSDPSQLDWLRKDLENATEPVIIFMHQPVFISDFFNEIGNANEILTIFDKANYTAVKAGKNSRIAAVFMGHDHVDRYGQRNEVHYFQINSASYAYHGGPYFYKDSLFAFVTLDPSGRLILEGRKTTYKAPDTFKAEFRSQISNHNELLLLSYS